MNFLKLNIARYFSNRNTSQKYGALSILLTVSCEWREAEAGKI